MTCKNVRSKKIAFFYYELSDIPTCESRTEEFMHFQCIFARGLLFVTAVGFSTWASQQSFAAPRFEGLKADSKQSEELKNETLAASKALKTKVQDIPDGSAQASTNPPTAAAANSVTSASARAGYSQEWALTGYVDFVKGSTKSKPEDNALNEQGLEWTAELTYGVFLGEFVEPIIEVAYTKENNKLGDFDGAKTNLSWGAGLLFNLPVVAEGQPSLLHLANWIPFGGLLVMSETESNSGKLASTSSANNKSLMTNLVVGVRYLPFQNVSLNSSLRMSYEKSSTSADADAKSGGERSNTRIQARLLGLSLLL